MAEDEEEPHAVGADDENAAAGDGEPEAEADEEEADADEEGPDAEEAEHDAEEEGAEEAEESTPAPGSSIDSKMRIEVDLLTYGALKKIAGKIADAVAEQVGAKGKVVLASVDVASALGPAILLQQQLDGLAAALEALAPSEDGEVLEGLVETTVAGLAATTGQVGELVKGLSDIAKMIEVSDTYSARSVGIDEPTLLTLLAGRLAAKSIETVLIADVAPFARLEASSLTRIVKTLGELRPGADEERRKALDEVEKAVAPLRESRSVPLQAQRLLAITGAAGAPALLTARALSAGGSYLERSHLFTRLGLADKLSFSAGAAVHYALYRMPEGTIAASDIVMGGSGKTRMPGTSQLFDPDAL